jgi:hypothetical protein
MSTATIQSKRFLDTVVTRTVERRTADWQACWRCHVALYGDFGRIQRQGVSLVRGKSHFCKTGLHSSLTDSTDFHMKCSFKSHLIQVFIWDLYLQRDFCKTLFLGFNCEGLKQSSFQTPLFQGSLLCGSCIRFPKSVSNIRN